MMQREGVQCEKTEAGTEQPIAPAIFFIVFHSGIRKRKNVFQVTQYKTCQILVQTFPEPWARGSPSVFHFSNFQEESVSRYQDLNGSTNSCSSVWLRIPHSFVQRFRVVSLGKTELEHNFTLAESRIKNDCNFC